MPFFEPPTMVHDSLSVGSESVPFTDSDVINYLHPGVSSDYVSAADALKNSDIYSVVNQLSSDLATVKLHADRARAQSILDNPTMTSNSHAFWQSVYAQMLLAGQAFAYRWRNQNGLDVRWEYLRPSQVNVFELNDHSGLKYTVTFDGPELGTLENVPQADVIHFRLMSQNGGMTGISPLSALSNELQIKNRSNQLTLSALARSIAAPGILSIEHGGLIDAAKKASRSRKFMKQIDSSNGGPVVLDQLETYTPLEMKADVAKLLSQTDWTGKQIAKVFGVPDSFLNGQGDQQSNIDQIKGMYINALNRYLRSIVSELDNKLKTHIEVNMRPAVDPLGDSFAGILGGLTKNNLLANNQATWVLQQSGYFPTDMPDAIKNEPKGGEDNAQGDSN